MTQLTQNIEAVKVPPLEDTEAGNTKAASVRSRTWMLTWNNYSEEEKDNFTKWGRRELHRLRNKSRSWKEWNTSLTNFYRI